MNVFDELWVVGIIGSRRRDTSQDAKLVDDAFKIIAKEHNWEIAIASGGCPKGGDRFAELMAKHYGVPIILFYPDKRNLKSDTRWGWSEIFKARNTEIAKISNQIIACVAEDRKGGTEDCVSKATTFGKIITLV